MSKTARIIDNIIQLDFSYDKELIANIKRRNLARPKSVKWFWEANAKCWCCPYLPSNIRELKELGFDLGNLEKFEKVTQKQEWMDLPKVEVNGANGLPPWEFQQECLQFLEWKKGTALLGLDMALGKSVIACLWALYSDTTTLIICPSTLKSQWVDYWKEWVNKPIIILDKRKGRRLEKGCNYVINYDILGYTKKEFLKGSKKKYKVVIQKDAWVEYLVKNNFDLIIGDEVQFCSNPSSIRGKCFAKICNNADEKLFLTGTPIKTKPSQFWLMLNLLDKAMFPSLYHFKQKYSVLENNGYGEIEKAGCKDPQGLHEKVSNVMIRFKKEDVLKDLPTKNRVIVPLEVDRKLYQKEVKIFQKNIKSIDMKSSDRLLELKNRIEELSRSAFELKKDSTIQWLNEWLEINTDKKIMIFGWHRAVVEFIHESYKDISVIYYGGMNNTKKKISKDKFIKDKKCRIFVGNAQSAGTGLDGFQTVCSDCAFVEVTQSPAESDQAEDRLVRPKQKSSVTCYYLPASNSVDLDIMEIWDEKRIMIDQIVEGKEVSDDSDLLMKLYDKYSK